MRPRRVDVRHDELQPLLRAGRHLADPAADHDRAGRTRRGELDEAQRVGDLVVVVGSEPDLVDVERLGAIDVGHRHGHELEPEIHAQPLSCEARGSGGVRIPLAEARRERAPRAWRRAAGHVASAAQPGRAPCRSRRRSPRCRRPPASGRCGVRSPCGPGGAGRGFTGTFAGIGASKFRGRRVSRRPRPRRSAMFRLVSSTLAALLVGALPGLAQDAAVETSPPSAPYQQVSELVKLPDFVPGLGQLFVDPATLPAGPFLAYDHDGRLVSTVYMIPVADLNPDKQLRRPGRAGRRGRPRRRLLQRRPSRRRGAARAPGALARPGRRRSAGREVRLTRRRAILLGGGLAAGLLRAGGRRAPRRRSRSACAATRAGRMSASTRSACSSRPGDTVRWLNVDPGNAHTATAYHPANSDRPRRIPRLPGPGIRTIFSSRRASR